MLTYKELNRLLALNTRLLLRARRKEDLERQFELLTHRAEIKNCMIQVLEIRLGLRQKKINKKAA